MFIYFVYITLPGFFSYNRYFANIDTSLRIPIVHFLKLQGNGHGEGAGSVAAG